MLASQACADVSGMAFPTSELGFLAVTSAPLQTAAPVACPRHCVPIPAVRGPF